MNCKTNALFACDALILLERLPSEIVTLAYLDPPRNIGSGSEWNIAKSNDLSDELFASYLSKVIQQVRRVLTGEGSLFVHWSPTSTLDMRLVMNQAFGDQPKYEITWHKKSFGHLANIGPKVDNKSILVYSKAEAPIYNPVFRPLSSEEKAKYPLRDERGQYMAAELTSPFDRPTAQFTWRGYQPPPRRSWRFSLDKLEALALNNRIHFPSAGGLPRLKRYLDEHPGVEIGTTWEHIPSVVPSHERAGYMQSQIPLALMERIVQLASNTGDQVLDPFCRSGTTLVAAQSLGRHWWGADSSVESHQIIVDRLVTCGLEVRRDYAVHTEAEVIKWPVVDAAYREVIVSIAEIAELQREMTALTDHILSLKKLMNIGGDDEGVEQAIEEMERWIITSLAKQSKSVDSYIGVVCSWLTGWERLDKASRSFLPQAELLFDIIGQAGGQDYSPFILHFCKALENELLIKLFTAYTDDLYDRHKNIKAFLAKDIDGEKTGKFAKLLIKRSCTYTLGDMNFILGLLKADGQTLSNSELLQDFRAFTVRYFNECIVDTIYLNQINRINNDFRNKSAHPNVLNSEVAQRCRDQVRSCLNELILNYKGGEPSVDS